MSALPHGSGERQDVDARQRAPDLRARALRTTCAAGQGAFSLPRTSRGYAQVALACAGRRARSPFRMDGEVRTGAAGRVTPTFLSALITTARARLKTHSDHGQYRCPRSRVVVPVVAVTSTGSILPRQTHVVCSEPPVRVCNVTCLAHLIICGSGHDGLLEDASGCRASRRVGGVTLSPRAIWAWLPLPLEASGT